MPNQPIYNIQLTKDQLQLASLALDTYSRLSSGQFWIAIPQVKTIQRILLRMDNESKDDFERHIVKAGAIMTGLGPHGSFGIFSPDLMDDARLAYHIHLAIRHQVWKDEGAKDKFVTHAHPADIVKGLEVKIELINQ